MHGIIRCVRIRRAAGAEHGIGESAVLLLQGCVSVISHVFPTFRVARSD